MADMTSEKSPEGGPSSMSRLSEGAIYPPVPPPSYYPPVNQPRADGSPCPGKPPSEGTTYPSAPPPGYYPPANQPNTVVVSPGYAIAQQPFPVTEFYRESPFRTRCPHCTQDVLTQTEYVTGNLTWLVCLAACVMGCFLGCCLIPFCVDAAKDVTHKCPNCQQQVAVYRRL